MYLGSIEMMEFQPVLRRFFYGWNEGNSPPSKNRPMKVEHFFASFNAALLDW